MIKLHALQSVKRKDRARVGRGIAAGRGKTAGRGTKGQKSRSGYNLPRRFEGGQVAITQRMPKLRGFKHHGEKPFAIQISYIYAKFNEGDTVTPETLIEKGFVKVIPKSGIKIIGDAKETKDLKFDNVSFSHALEAKLLSSSSSSQTRSGIHSAKPAPKKRTKKPE